MTALLVGLLILGQAETISYVVDGPPDSTITYNKTTDTLNLLGSTGSTVSLPAAKAADCFLALKESHEATRAAWAPRFGEHWIFQATPALSNVGMGMTCTLGTPAVCTDQCGIVESPEWHECRAEQIRANQEAEAKERAKVDKAREALDRVDKACGFGEER